MHYIQAHSYLPPSAFVEAVLRCPDFESEEYGKALRVANRGMEPPLETDEIYTRKFRETIKKTLAQREKNRQKS